MEVALEGASLVARSPIGRLPTVQMRNDEGLSRTEMEGVERRGERGEVEKVDVEANIGGEGLYLGQGAFAAVTRVV